jgi:predicted unusual protein kinase regulating ubiquinone biosynthesis (AarF/ABC1/UbiB family)
MRRYGAMLAGEEQFVVPAPVDELTGPGVLTMDFIASKPIDTLADAPQDVRDRVMGAMLDLVLRELFTFGFMQTDPNFANYRWQADTGRIVLLDFGATRPVPPATALAYRRLLIAGITDDRAALKAALLEIGFVSPITLERHAGALDGMIDVLMNHLGRTGLFDFADRSFVASLRGHAETILADRAAWHIPPADTLFVQRKVSGTALLAVRLNARMPLRAMVEDLLAVPAA